METGIVSPKTKPFFSITLAEARLSSLQVISTGEICISFAFSKARASIFVPYPRFHSD